METLPGYMGGINPRHLELYCSLALLASIAAGQSGPEWDKFSHVKHVKAYASEGDNTKKWYVLYTAVDPYNLETNFSLSSFMSRGTLTYVEDTQRFEYVFKMTRKTFSYICSLVYVPSVKDMNSYTFDDGRVLCLEDRVAIALKRLYSSEPPETIGSSVSVSESIVLLVTESFVDAVWERARHHLRWPDSSKIDKIKSMFEKIHSMHNCCGVICTTQIPFGPNWDHEKNDSILVQLVIDPEMRFRSIWCGGISSMNQSSILHESNLFKMCEKGARLNGSKLKVGLDGSEVREYIIGDAGYPLLPWLLTRYQEEDLSESKAEFNRRHSTATTCTLKALARFRDTWKYLQGETSCAVSPETLVATIHACCLLHNIVIDMEDDAAMPSVEEPDYCEEVRQLANEDAVRARDMLSQYFLTSMSFYSEGTLSFFEDTQRFELVFKMTRKTFSYICSLVKWASLKDMYRYTFVDGRVLSLEDRVAVALIRLYSSEPPETLGSSVGVNESTIMLVTERFVAAVCGRAKRHEYWPESSATDEIKSMFCKIHNMHNCCGVICTTHVPSGPNWDREKNDSILVQLVIDPEMRFKSIWWGRISSMNQASILHESYLFKMCEKGAWLNGSKLKVGLDGSEVGEYIVGDAGYPLLPWLLTPYQEEDLSDSKAEFNRRHNAATTCAQKARARFKDTWKYLQGETSCPVNQKTIVATIHACCYLHNIIIDMEDDAAMLSVEDPDDSDDDAATSSVEEPDDSEELRQVANEDAVRARDMLSQYFLTTMSSESGVGPVDAEEDHEVAASGSGDEDKEQEVQTRTADEEILN